MQKRLNNVSLEDDIDMHSDSSDDTMDSITVARRARENVRIPNVYFEKTYEERQKDTTDLL
jgi:hypothetical protein